MKFLMWAVICVSIISCAKKDKAPANSREEISYPAISAIAECQRAKEVRGSNSIFNLVKAAPGDLQKIVINTNKKSIQYQEAREPEDFNGESPFVYRLNKFFFKTKSKNLLLTFPDREFGLIENDLLGKEYVVGILTYHDRSGYHDPFLCTRP